MKRLIVFLVVLRLLFALCACAEYQREETLPTDPPGVTEEPTGPPTDASTTPPTISTEPPTEPHPMAAYVETARLEVIKVTNADGSTTELTYRYPRVRLNGDDAKFWNSRIVHAMDEIVVQARTDAKNGSVRYETMDYSAWLSGDILVVLMWMQQWGVEYTEYQVGLFDLTTSEELDSGELFCRLTGQRTPASMLDVLSLHLGNWFDMEHQTLEQNEDLMQQREKTLAVENLEKAWLYLDEAGALMAVVPAYTVAGTEMTTAFLELTDFSPVEVSVAPNSGATLEELVTVYRSEHLVYTDSLGNEYDITVALPWVNLNTPDGRDCNWELQHELEEYLDEAISYLEDGLSTHIKEIGYDAWLWNNTLTVLVWQYTTYEDDTYFVYTFDLETGKQMTNDEIAALWGADQTWQQTLADTMGETYREKYKSMTEDEFYREQLEMTTSQENILASKLYPNADGEAMVSCLIYSLAGAYAYMHLLSVPLS